VTAAERGDAMNASADEYRDQERVKIMPKQSESRGFGITRWGAIGLLALAGASSAWGLGCSSTLHEESIGTTSLELINCGTALGVAPLDNSCGHGWAGPFGDPGGLGSPGTPIVASTNLNFSGASPNLASPQILYRVGLPGSGQSAVKFTPSFTQDYAVVTDVDLPFTVLTAGGATVSPILDQNIGTGCGARRPEFENPSGVSLTRARVFPLTAGNVYRIVFGPSTAPSVNVLVDEPNDFLNLYFVDADADTYGDWDRPVASECTAPAGTVVDDRDCNDTNASVNPAASEVVDGIDNDCNGVTDAAASGDLQMVSVSLASAVTRLLVGQTATVVVDQRVKNRGSNPTDAQVTRTASATGVGTITPASSSSAVNDLQSFEERKLSTTYTVSCSDYGTATFTVNAEILPTTGTDPDLTNNSGSVTFSVQCIACVHTTEEFILADDTHVTSARALGGTYLEVGANSATLAVSNGARVNGNAFLRSTGRVEGDLTLAGTLLTQGPFTVTGTLLQNTPVTIPPIASFTVTVGSTDVNIAADTTTSLAPGSYDEGFIGADAIVALQAGTYNFRTLNIEPGVDLNFNTSLADAFVNAEESLAFGDRTEINVTGPGKVAFYTNDPDMVRIGTDNVFNASLSAPRGEIHAYSRTNITGCTSGREIRYEPQVTQIANGMPTGDPSGGTPPPTPTCSDGMQNGTETGVDCGGSCPACPTCTDGVQNGTETGVDCGGSCPSPCPTCTDGVQNGTETGIDCGGSCPNPCPVCNAATYQAETMFHSAGGPTPGGWNLHSNGYVSTNHNFTGGLSRVTVVAAGQLALGVGPHMVVRVGGIIVGNVTLTNTSYQSFNFNFTTTSGNKEIRITFDNDFFGGGQDRNLLLDLVSVSCPPPAPALSATLPVTSNWGTGYCVNLAITNNGTAATSTWTAIVNTNQSSIYVSWNATFSALSGPVTIRPLNWNSVIAPGQTITSVGFCANRNPGTNNLPTVVSITSP
jgi:hypothetical protein